MCVHVCLPMCASGVHVDWSAHLGDGGSWWPRLWCWLLRRRDFRLDLPLAVVGAAMPPLMVLFTGDVNASGSTPGVLPSPGTRCRRCKPVGIASTAAADADSSVNGACNHVRHAGSAMHSRRPTGASVDNEYASATVWQGVPVVVAATPSDECGDAFRWPPRRCMLVAK